MYGYSTPRKPDFSQARVMVCESELCAFLQAFPELSREDVLAAMLKCGPMRRTVEQELQRLAAGKSLARS